jgi:hypothetical protein
MLYPPGFHGPPSLSAVLDAQFYAFPSDKLQGNYVYNEGQITLHYLTTVIPFVNWYFSPHEWKTIFEQSMSILLLTRTIIDVLDHHYNIGQERATYTTASTWELNISQNVKNVYSTCEINHVSVIKKLYRSRRHVSYAQRSKEKHWL